VASNPHTVMLSCPTTNFTTESPGSPPALPNPPLPLAAFPPRESAAAQAAPRMLRCQTPPLLGATLRRGSRLQASSSPAARAEHHPAHQLACSRGRPAVSKPSTGCCTKHPWQFERAGSDPDAAEGRARLSPAPRGYGERQGASWEQDGSSCARAQQARLGDREVAEPPWVREICAGRGPDTQPRSQPLDGTHTDVAVWVQCKSGPDGSGLPGQRAMPPSPGHWCGQFPSSSLSPFPPRYTACQGAGRTLWNRDATGKASHCRETAASPQERRKTIPLPQGPFALSQHPELVHSHGCSPAR